MKTFAFFIFIAFFFISCNKETADLPAAFTGFEDGVFIVNEGPYNTGTGTVSFWKRDGSEVNHNIYQQANSLIPLGNIVFSMTIISNTVFIAVNNADKIELAHFPSFSSTGRISGISFPAYILFVGDHTAYVSCWDNTIRIINTKGFEVSGQIPAGTGPTKMALINDKVWALNQGGLGIDSTVTIIDIASHQAVKTVMVYPRPTGIQQDKYGKVWIMCSGKGYWHTGGSSSGHLVAVDPEDYSITKDFSFPGAESHPEKLVINNQGDVLFYNFPGGVFAMGVDEEALPALPFIPYIGIPYSLGYDSKDNVIYISNPLDYAHPGWVYRYRGDNGAAIDSVRAGIVPSEFLFVP
ncbi:MAG: hypothetical protein JXA03_01630 [Bacteroidales bacterium]|nr:hypothetical protein [Bacteroidales bacterium]